MEAGRLLLFYYLDNQRNNADKYKAILEQFRKRYVHPHPSFPEGKRKLQRPSQRVEGLTATVIDSTLQTGL